MFDLIIIGGGIAGYSAAELSASEGYKTLIIDKHRLGGTHIHRGSGPLKYLLEHTRQEINIKSDVDDDHPHFDKSYASVIKQKDANVRKESKEIHNRLIDNNITVIKGKAKIVGRSYQGFVVTSHQEDYTGKRVLIATGSTPFIPTIPGVKKATYSGFVLSSDNVLEINNIPKDLVVIGGGIIGLEIASYFNDLGCHVTIIEKRDKVARILDTSLSNAIVDSYKHQGIKILLNSEVVEIESQKVHYNCDGIKHIIECERALLSIGRAPMLEDLGLETLGVKTNIGIIVDEFGQTSVEDVYAAGDVIGHDMYKSKSKSLSIKSVNHMLGKEVQDFDNKVPIILRTKPEIALIGESEQSVMAKNIHFQTSLIRKNQTINSGNKTIEFEGFCKVIVNKANDRIVGVHVFDNKAEDIIRKIHKCIDMVFDIEVIEKLYLEE